MKDKNKIKQLFLFDFDGCIIDSIMPDEGKKIWEKEYNKKFPHVGWWSKPESLDINIFNIKPFQSVLNILKKETNKSDTYVIILTSRLEKLRPYVQNVLDINNIHVNRLDMKKNEKTKGNKILDYVQKFPNLKEINTYDDMESNIQSYKEIQDKIPKKIKFNIFLTNEGKINQVNESKNNLLNIIHNEVQNFIKKIIFVFI